MPTIDPILLGALREGLFASLCLGLACACLWGLWLLAAPAAALRFAAAADRWVGSEPWFERLNRRIETSRWVYRHHRLVGGLITIAASVSLARWATAYDRDVVLATLGRGLQASGMDWIVPALEAIFVSFNVLFLAVGLMVLIRPSLLKLPERYANRWVEVSADSALDRRYDPLTATLKHHPRPIGTLIALVCGSLFWQLLALS